MCKYHMRVCNKYNQNPQTPLDTHTPFHTGGYYTDSHTSTHPITVRMHLCVLHTNLLLWLLQLPVCAKKLRENECTYTQFVAHDHEKQLKSLVTKLHSSCGEFAKLPLSYNWAQTNEERRQLLFSEYGGWKHTPLNFLTWDKSFRQPVFSTFQITAKHLSLFSFVHCWQTMSGTS